MSVVVPRRVKTFNIALAYALCFVAFIMQMVMQTALDRKAYLHIFEHPFLNGRIEPGFQYYTDLLKVSGVSADVGIVVTCVLIYGLLARVWFAYVKTKWLESILLFNFFTFSLFNYYLGTSIRMGLATAVALYATMRIAKGNKIFLIALWLSPLLHYGTAPFALIVTWVLMTRKVSWGVHRLLIALTCVAMPLVVFIIVFVIGLNQYYIQYFVGTLGQTGRVFPFTFAFFTAAILLSSLQGTDSLVRRIVFYGVPFLLYGAISGVPIFSKMIIANIFLSAMLVTEEYWRTYVKNVDANLRLLMAVMLNNLAIAYALAEYNFV